MSARPLHGTVTRASADDWMDIEVTLQNYQLNRSTTSRLHPLEDGSDNSAYQNRESIPLGSGEHKGEVLLPAGPGTRVEEVIQSFLCAAVDNVNTRRAYSRHLNDACRFFEVMDVRQLHGQDLAAYRAQLLKDGRGVATHGQALGALRAFLKWLNGVFSLPQFSGEILQATLRAPKAKVLRPYQILTEAEVDRVIQQAGSPRDLAIVMILLGAGLRVAELVALDVQDLHSDVEEGDVLHVRAGKGSKDRLVPVHEEVGLTIHSYLLSSGRTTSSGGALLLALDRGRRSRVRQRISQRAVRNLIKGLCHRAGIAKQLSPHSFRHTYAIRALHHSGNLVAISKLLGHASLATTQVYLNHLGFKELRDAIPHLPQRIVHEEQAPR